jgi:hypothetical protein
MERSEGSRRGMLVIGIGLIVIGGLALAGRALSIDVFGLGWPMLVIAPGVLLFVAAIAVGGRPGVGLAVPGTIITVIGIVLAVQSATGLWATWAYVWALVAPGGVGLGFILYGLLTGQRDFVGVGVPILMTGIGLFLGFALFFEGVIGLSGGRVVGAEPLLAIGLVAVGLVLLVSATVGRRERSG